MTGERLSLREKRRLQREIKRDERRLSKPERAEKRRTLIFLVPSLLGVLLFFVLPFIVVIYYSFIDNPINAEFVMFDNFTALFKNSAFILSMKNTGIFTAIAVPLAVIIPLLLALLLERKIPGKSIFRTILISPLMVPVASIVLIWQVLFHYNGAVNDVLGGFGVIPIDWFKSDYGIIVIVLLFLWKNVGYNMILFMASLANVPKEITEAAIIDGAGGWRVFTKIKLPYLSSSMFFVGILSIINSFKVFREVYLLAGSHPYDALYMLQHFMNNNFKDLDYQRLSAAAIIMCAVVILIIGIMFIVDAKLGGKIEE